MVDKILEDIRFLSSEVYSTYSLTRLDQVDNEFDRKIDQLKQLFRQNYDKKNNELEEQMEKYEDEISKTNEIVDVVTSDKIVSNGNYYLIFKYMFNEKEYFLIGNVTNNLFTCGKNDMNITGDFQFSSVSAFRKLLPINENLELVVMFEIE